MAEKSDQAFRTIGELSDELGVPQHVLRYWETRFSQLRPMQRAGNRRYYRPADVALARRIHGLLNEQGYTIKGVQRVLEQKASGDEPAPAPVSAAPPAPAMPPAMPQVGGREQLRALRAHLAQALAETEA